MKIQQHPGRVYDRVFQVSEDSAEGTLALVQRKLRKLPHATGELAASYRLESVERSVDTIRNALVSDAPHAAVIERGGWVEGKGPHVSGSSKGRHILRDTCRRDWGRRLAKGLRQ
jgi:hypothetical protein